MVEYKVLIDLYGKSNAFKRYVDAYCTKHGVDVEEALTHAIICNYSEHILEDIRRHEETV